MITYGEFEAEVIRNVGNRDDPITKALILNHSNSMIEQMALIYEWDELQTISDTSLLVGHSATYQLLELGVEDLYKVYSISLFDQTRWLPPMKGYPYFQWERDIKPVQGFVTGRPGSYTVIGNQYIEFSCPASLNYPLRIYYYQKAPHVSTLYDNTTPDPTFVMPFDNMQQVMEAIVSGYVWLSLGDQAMAQTWFNIAKGLADTYVKEAKQILNFQVVSRRDKPVIGVPWADPFVNSVR